MNIESARHVDLKRLHDVRGELVIGQWMRPADSIAPLAPPEDLPFDVKRAFLLYPESGDVVRGGHAHIHCKQLVIPAWGMFRATVKTPDNPAGVSFWMTCPNRPLIVPEMNWLELDQWSSKSCALVLCSDRFVPTDYLREWDRYCLEARSCPAKS
jgi:hypothetical protein